MSGTAVEPSDAGNRQPADYRLTAYSLADDAPSIVAAGTRRAWMDSVPSRAAYRCLPMLIANQAGWFILNRHAVRITWDGGASVSSLRIEYRAPVPSVPRVVSHFGHGIVTWRIPMLFRTSPDFMLLARGPANCPKPHAFALEGLIETDWFTATFTMNWKMLTIQECVTFEEGEPICMIVPQRKHDLECFSPTIQPIESEAELAATFEDWKQRRTGFLARREPGAWQKEYFQGKGAPRTSGAHRTKLTLNEFQNG